MLQEFIANQFFHFFLIFMRVGVVMSLIPAFSEQYITKKSRLLLALAISLVVLPVLKDKFPAAPTTVEALVYLMFVEAFIGFFVAMTIKLVFEALQIAGVFISNQTGLAAAQIFNPGLAQQGALYGALLYSSGIFLVFATDTHHLFIQAMVGSYQMFPPGEMAPIGDFSEMITKTVSKSWLIGFQLSGPVLLISFVIHLGMGMVAKLVPSINIFFVSLPIQVVVGIIVMMVTMSAMLTWFLATVQEHAAFFIN